MTRIDSISGAGLGSPPEPAGLLEALGHPWLWLRQTQPNSDGQRVEEPCWAGNIPRCRFGLPPLCLPAVFCRCFTSFYNRAVVLTSVLLRGTLVLPGRRKAILDAGMNGKSCLASRDSVLRCLAGIIYRFEATGAKLIRLSVVVGAVAVRLKLPFPRALERMQGAEENRPSRSETVFPFLLTPLSQWRVHRVRLYATEPARGLP
ncbi:hypothetical protein LY76DRAFT_183288 [Colletotrichum caudatum]|nr:hypothetical protein LY76DRAFT_183288 [Colletotrichum caudatum]